jgi:multidrug efflux system outer membrane protein
VRAAESQLKAANWQIGVARSAWFPSLSLTASGGVASSELSSLFNSGSKVFSVGGSFVQPLLFSGRISAGIDSAKAARDAAGESYRQTVANAFREVLDALVARRTAQEVTQAEVARVAALADTLRLARLRYQSGLISQFELLGIERGLLAAQGNLVEARRVEAAAAVQVWSALGG